MRLIEINENQGHFIKDYVQLRPSLILEWVPLIHCSYMHNMYNQYITYIELHYQNMDFPSDSLMRTPPSDSVSQLVECTSHVCTCQMCPLLCRLFNPGLLVSTYIKCAQLMVTPYVQLYHLTPIIVLSHNSYLNSALTLYYRGIQQRVLFLCVHVIL